MLKRHQKSRIYSILKDKMTKLGQYTGIDNALVSAIFSSLPEEEVFALKKQGLCFNDFEKKAFRPLTFAERKVNFNQLDRKLQTVSNRIQKEIKTITNKQRDDLIKQLGKAVSQNDPSLIANIQTRFKGDLSKVLSDAQKELFDTGKVSASKELDVKTPATKKETAALIKLQSDALTKEYANRLEDTAKTAAADVIRNNGSITSLTPEAMAAGVSGTINTIATRMTNKLGTVSTIGALNIGRDSVVQRYPERVYAMQYSAIMDKRTTNLCLSLDGRVVPFGSDDYRRWTPPNHFNCRSAWVAINNDEKIKPRIGTIPKSLKSSTTLEGAKMPKRPIIKKGSAAVASIKSEIRQREAKLTALKSANKFPNRQKQHEKVIDNLKKAIKGK